VLPDGREVAFEIDAFARYCLLNGVDETTYLLSQQAAIDAYEQRTRA
jgi:3-isopropylmalate/(R)-2-methylmalate dehydratase small subunit